MQHEIWMLSITAASIGFFHTLLGPDHYLPFIMMSRSGQWALPKTMMVTLLCGIGHVASSVALGFVGIAMGMAVSRVEALEGYRGDWAAWGLILFGGGYFLWGVWQAIRNKSHCHLHVHGDSIPHVDVHFHQEMQQHNHNESQVKKYTPWILFTIFVLGPCEPLIPILMYPAALKSISGLVFVTLVFAIVTIGTMMAVVLIGTASVHKLKGVRLERYMHAVSGAMILLCGVAIRFLGL